MLSSDEHCVLVSVTCIIDVSLIAALWTLATAQYFSEYWDQSTVCLSTFWYCVCLINAHIC